MRTVVLGQNTDVEAMIARRRSLGQDRFDEVWKGEYHVAPGPTMGHALVDHALAMLLAPYADAAGLHGSTAFNLGDGPADYRVPDGGYHRGVPTGTWISTAPIVVEVVSPDDETYAKFDFYAAHGVEELIVADPSTKLVRCFRRRAGTFAESEGSELLGVQAAELTAGIAWP
jgi:Uma2 family endonuclease